MECVKKIPVEEDLNGSGWEALGFKILIRPFNELDEKNYRIAVPQGTRGQFEREEGVVVSMGKSVEARHIEDLQVGDTVIFNRHAGLPIKGDDEKSYRFMTDEDICLRRKRK